MKWLLAFLLSLSAAMTSFAAAPVVDESENYALLNEGSTQAASEPSDSDEIALAKDDDRTSMAQDNDLLNKIKGLQQDVQQLRGQLDQQAHELKQLQQQQLSFYKDIDARMQSKPLPGQAKFPISAANTSFNFDKPYNAAKPVPAVPVSTVHANPAEEQISYLAAYDLVKSKEYDQALTAMQTFVTQFPQGGYSANAHYWLGELYLIKQHYPQAIEHFETVLNHFPSSSKAAACSLKIGYALAASGKEKEAKQTLLQVVRNYPDTAAAQLATTKLKALKV